MSAPDVQPRPMTYSPAMADAHNYIRWVLSRFNGYLRGRILEVGLGHGSFYPQLANVQLVDYKVRILTPGSGTAAVTRVMIESADGTRERWRTVGVSANIIDASYEALNDALTWKLLKLAQAPVSQ